ncbi:hypothetical protein K8I61_09305 [bacterium]|nr:hypothetical protein [bacterium]
MRRFRFLVAGLLLFAASGAAADDDAGDFDFEGSLYLSKLNPELAAAFENFHATSISNGPARNPLWVGFYGYGQGGYAAGAFGVDDATNFDGGEVSDLITFVDPAWAGLFSVTGIAGGGVGFTGSFGGDFFTGVDPGESALEGFTVNFNLNDQFGCGLRVLAVNNTLWATGYAVDDAFGENAFLGRIAVDSPSLTAQWDWTKTWKASDGGHTRGLHLLPNGSGAIVAGSVLTPGLQAGGFVKGFDEFGGTTFSVEYLPDGTENEILVDFFPGPEGEAHLLYNEFDLGSFQTSKVYIVDPQNPGDPVSGWPAWDDESSDRLLGGDYSPGFDFVEPRRYFLGARLAFKSAGEEIVLRAYDEDGDEAGSFTKLAAQGDDAVLADVTAYRNLVAVSNLVTPADDQLDVEVYVADMAVASGDAKEEIVPRTLEVSKDIFGDDTDVGESSAMMAFSDTGLLYVVIGYDDGDGAAIVTARYTVPLLTGGDDDDDADDDDADDDDSDDDGAGDDDDDDDDATHDDDGGDDDDDDDGCCGC